MMNPTDGERYDAMARDLADAKVEIERLGAFRDAVYAAITENAGAQAAYAYIRQDRWDEIKAAEKVRMQ